MSTAAANLWFRWCVAFALLLSLDAGAGQPLSDIASGLRATGTSTGLRQPAKDLDFGYGRESPNNQFSDWTSHFPSASLRLPERRMFYGGPRADDAFGLREGGGYRAPLFLSGDTSVGGSPVETLMPGSLYGFMQRNFADGWGLGLGLGLRYNEYTTTNVVSVLAERSWSNFRGSYTLYSGQPESMFSAANHRLQLSYYYDDRNAFGMSYTNGREPESVGPLRGMSSADVQGWSVGGQHWLTPSWALTYDLVQHEQGALSRKQGLQLGVRRNF
jgi:YaiO family outer membrane protein